MGLIGDTIETLRAGARGRSGLASPSSWLLSALGGGSETKAGVTVTAESSLTLTPVYAAVTLLADSIAMMPIHLYSRQRGRVRKMEVASDHALDRVLHRRPNSYMTSFELRRFLVGQLKIYGNAYVEIEWGKDGQVRALFPLRADRVTVLWRKGKDLWYRVSGTDGPDYFVPQKEMVHVRDFSLSDGILGQSAVVVGKEALGLAGALDEFAARFFANGAHMGGVISFPEQLASDDRKAYEAMFKVRRTGLEHAHEPMLLDEGGEWKAYGVSPKDAQAIEQRRFSTETVARLWRIPPPLLQDLSRATFHNVEQLFIQFLQMALLPLVVNIEEAFEAALLVGDEAGEYAIKMTPDVVLRADMATRAEAYRKMVEIGALNVDEVRDLENRNPHAGGVGSVPLQPANLVPLGTPAGTVGVGGQRPGSEGGEPDASVDGDSDTRAGEGENHEWTRMDTNGEGDLDTRGSGAQRGEEEGRIGPRGRGEEKRGREHGTDGRAVGGGATNVPPGTADVCRLAATRDAPAVQSRLALRGLFEPLLAEAFLRVAKREKADVARAAEKLLGKGDVQGFQDFMVAFFAKHPSYMEQVLAVTYEQYGVALAEAAAAEIGGEVMDGVDAAAAAELRSTIAQWVGESKATLESLYLDAGNPEELLDRVKEQLAKWVESRPGAWGKDNGVDLESRIARVVWQANGIEKVVWRTSSPCPLCKQMEGRVVGITSSFAAQGEVIEGDGGDPEKKAPRLTVGRTVYGPRLHRGCQCRLEAIRK